MALAEKDVLDVLRNVEDPDLHRDIVSLGFIKNLKIQGTQISFDLELTTPACPVKDWMKEECRKKVKALPGVSEVVIRMTSNVRPLVQTSIDPLKEVRNMIAVASGKGGVGKSTVATNLAVALAKSGAQVGLLDADIYGPSQPMMLGITERPQVIRDMVIPVMAHGLKVISMGVLTGDDTPVIWRGPMIAGVISQFLGQVAWGPLDYLVVDLPPGTGDAQLTLAQKAPLSGAIIVTTPQEISLIDARKGLRMFQQVNVPVLGIVENMSYFICPHCHEKEYLLGEGGGKRIASALKLPLLAEIPMDAKVVETSDRGIPIVVESPDHFISQVYFSLSGQVAAQLSILSASKSTTC